MYSTSIPTIGSYEGAKLLNIMMISKMTEREGFVTPIGSFQDTEEGLTNQIGEQLLAYYDFIFDSDVYDRQEQDRSTIVYQLKEDYKAMAQNMEQFFQEESIYRRFFQKHYQGDYDQFHNMVRNLQQNGHRNDVFVDGLIRANRDTSVLKHENEGDLNDKITVYRNRLYRNIMPRMRAPNGDASSMDWITSLGEFLGSSTLRETRASLFKAMAEVYDDFQVKVEEIKEEVNSQTEREQQRSETYNYETIRQNLLRPFEDLDDMEDAGFTSDEIHAARELAEQRGWDRYIVPMEATDERLVPVNGRAKIITSDRMENETWYAIPYATPEEQVPEGFASVGRYGVMNDVCSPEHRPSPERFVVVEVHMFVKLWRSFWERFIPEDHAELLQAYNDLLGRETPETPAPASSGSDNVPQSPFEQESAPAVTEGAVEGTSIPQGVYRMDRDGEHRFEVIKPDGTKKHYTNPIHAVQEYKQAVPDHDGSVYDYDDTEQRVFRIEHV